MKIGIKKFIELMDEQGLGRKNHDEVKMCMNCFNAVYGESDDHQKIKAGIKKYGFTPCTCKEIEICEFCAAPGIDANLFLIIQELNRKGYRTNGCCEGHNENGYPYLNIWITFDDDCLGELAEPITNEFTYKSLGGKGFHTLDYTDDYKYYIKMYPDVSYRDDIKRKKIKALSDFVHSLPAREGYST